MSRKKTNRIEFADIQSSDGLPAESHACGINQKAYEAPVLLHYGDVRDITLGPTPGIGESGNELGRRNPP